MSLGYGVEWRVVNSAAYGFPQRRKRVYIYAEKDYKPSITDGIMSAAFPCELGDTTTVSIDSDPYAITQEWDAFKVSPFFEAGTACDGKATTARVTEQYDGTRKTLGNILIPASDVPQEYWLDPSTVGRWQYLKGHKREKRVAKNGHEYWYSEGAMSFPDPTDKPSRTILTGEGGRGASRFKHVVEQDGRLRRLVPVELERLQGFPDEWTNIGMTDGQRAFCMGNALVVGVVERIGRAIQEHRKQ
jgi:DNA (cytosine-5)-methyltransferase 1